MDIRKTVESRFKKGIEVIKEERKNLNELLKDIEKRGLITTEKIKKKNPNVKIPNPLRFHDVRFKRSIRTLIENMEFIEKFKNHNRFCPFILQINPEIPNKKTKKIEIKHKIEENIPQSFEFESFLLLPFKKEIKEKIKQEIKETIFSLKGNLDILSTKIYQDKSLKEEEINYVKETGKEPLTQTGKLWDFLILSVPDKELLAKFIEPLAFLSYEELMKKDEKTISRFCSDETAKRLIDYLERYEKFQDIRVVQPLRTSILLFNQYLSKLEKDIILKKYYREENFNRKYINFLKAVDKIKEVFNIKIELTDAQKILTYSFVHELQSHMEHFGKNIPVTFINTSEVGTGKTFTIPFIAYILSSVILSKTKRKSVFLIITEANLLLETIQKLTEEVGIDRDQIEIVHNLPESIKPWKFYLISKNRLQNLNKQDVDIFTQNIKKKNLKLNLIIDEASWIKSEDSKTVYGYQLLKNRAVKRNIIGFEMLMTATPVSNDTSDCINFINPDLMVQSSLFKKDRHLYETLRRNYYEICEEFNKISFREACKLAYLSMNRNLKINDEAIKGFCDPKGIIFAGMFNALDKKDSTDNEETISTVNMLSKAGVSFSPVLNLKPNHTGSKDKTSISTGMAVLSHLSNFKGIDRILNIEEINSSVKTDSIILKTNPFEALAFYELIKNSHRIIRLKKFKKLIEFLDESKIEIKKVRNEQFNIRHSLILENLKLEGKLKILEEFQKVEIEGTQYKLKTYIVNREKYIKFLEFLNKNPEHLKQLLLLEIEPQLFVKEKMINEEIKNAKSNQQIKELKNVLKKIKNEMEEAIKTICSVKDKDLNEILKTQIKQDIQIIKSDKEKYLKVSSMVLESFSWFSKMIEIDIKSHKNYITSNEIKRKKIDTVLEQTGLILSIYSELFHASENLMIPSITFHVKKTAKNIVRHLHDEGISITNVDIDKISDFIAKKCSTTLNTIKKAKRYANKFNIPVMNVSSYRDTAVLLKEDNDYFIDGNIPVEKRKKIIDILNTPENSKNLTATAMSVLKGISLFYIPYGIMPESPKNAEFRTQIAGRLRTLFDYHFRKIDSIEDKTKKEHFNILKTNQKYFDIVSSEIMQAFPLIQQGKNLFIELTKYIAQHEKLTGIKAIDCVSPEDKKFSFVFNKKIIEKYSLVIFEKEFKDFVKFLKENVDSSLSTDEFINLAERYIDKITEENLKKTTIYKLLENKEYPAEIKSKS